MERILRKLRRIRLVYRRSSPLVKTVVLSAIALSLVALLTLSLTIGAARKNTADLADQAAKLEQEQQDLQNKIDNQGSLEGVKDYAEDELDLVDPDIVVIDPKE